MLLTSLQRVAASTHSAFLWIVYSQSFKGVFALSYYQAAETIRFIAFASGLRSCRAFRGDLED